MDKGIQHRYQWLIFLVAFGVSFIILQNVVFTTSRIEGNSMAPNYHDGDFVMVLKQNKQLMLNDVIIMKAPDKSKAHYIKRIIGESNQTIAFINNRLYRNGYQTTESFLKPGTKTVDYVWIQNGNPNIPNHHYFVLGDNRKISKDSRSFGVVPESKITGKVIGTYWHIKQ
jgi:signal peptidase I